MRRMSLVLLLGLGGCGGVIEAPPAPVALAVEPAAPFHEVAADGKVYDLEALKGKWVVLEWYDRSCPCSRKHYDTGNMQQLQKTYTEKGVVWLSVCSTAPGRLGYLPPKVSLQAAKAEGSLATGLLLDVDGSMARAYGVRATLHMFVIDPWGNIAYSGAMDDIRSMDPQAVADAHNYVVAALDAGLAGREIAVKRTKPYGCSVKYN